MAFTIIKRRYYLGSKDNIQNPAHEKEGQEDRHADRL